MKETKVTTRRYNKETYTFILHEPEYPGEKGVCGIEITPYYTVDTPENGLGYSDTVFITSDLKTTYTAYRYLPKWILAKIKDVIIKLNTKYWSDLEINKQL